MEESAEGSAERPDLPEGVPPLSSLYLYISGSCNLACSHCWISPELQVGGQGGQFLEIRHAEKALKEAAPLGLRSVKLTGGEPMLHPEFRRIVRMIHDAGYRIQIETNGTLADRRTARFLKQTLARSFVSVSVDGSDKETHEGLRGLAGSFDRTLEGIRHLVEQGFRPQLICTLHKGNLHQLAEIIAMAEELGCGSVKFNHVQQIGRGKPFSREHGVGVAELLSRSRWLERDIVRTTAIPVIYDIPMAFHSIRRLVNDAVSRCTVRNILSMLPDGALSLCGIGFTVPELIYGHIENGSLRELWCRSPGLVELRKQVPAELEGVCARCLHRDACLGACVANNFHTRGRLNAPSLFCELADAAGLFPASRKKQGWNAEAVVKGL